MCDIYFRVTCLLITVFTIVDNFNFTDIPSTVLATINTGGGGGASILIYMYMCLKDLNIVCALCPNVMAFVHTYYLLPSL